MIYTARDEKGFTLLEALIATTILMFGLMAVVTMIDVSFNTTVLSKNMTKATELAAMMMDRIRLESSLATEVYSTDIDKLNTFSNTVGALVLDTANPDPAFEPARSIFQAWKAFIAGPDGLPEGRGIVTITPYDPNRAGNHYVVVQVTWRGILTRGVRLETVMTSAE